MNQHRMSQEAMLHLLFERIRANRGEPELNITMLGGSGPPQPPGAGGAVRRVRLRGKQKPYDKGVEAAAESSKPPPPPPPAPEAVLLGNAPKHMAAIADAPQQIQAPRGRSRSRTKATAGAGRELKDALDEADKRLGPEKFRIDSPSETPQLRPASAKPRGRPRKKAEAETPQIAVVPFERPASKHEKEEVPQMVRAPRVRSRSKHDETPQMPKAKAVSYTHLTLPTNREV